MRLGLGEEGIGAEVGGTVLVEALSEVRVGARTLAVPPDGLVVDGEEMMVPLTGLLRVAIVPLPAIGDDSAIQGCSVRGSILIPLGSAPDEGILHS